MTRAKQKAEEYNKSLDYHDYISDNLGAIAYREGYEQAEKDTIERAVKWLEEHADSYNGSESAFDHMEEEMITDFRKSMEEKQ